MNSRKPRDPKLARRLRDIPREQREIAAMKSLPRLMLACGIAFVLAVPAFGASVAELLAEGQAAFQRGDMVAAREAFSLVYQLDARNQTAITFLRRIKAQASKTGTGRERENQLAAVIIPKVDFKEATLGAALEFLKQQVAKGTDGKVPLSFVLQIPDEVAKSTPVTLSLSNTPLTEVLRYLGGLANVTFSYEPYAVVVKPKGAPAATTSVGTTTPAPVQ